MVKPSCEHQAFHGVSVYPDRSTASDCSIAKPCGPCHLRESRKTSISEVDPPFPKAVMEAAFGMVGRIRFSDLRSTVAFSSIDKSIQPRSGRRSARVGPQHRLLSMGCRCRGGCVKMALAMWFYSLVKPVRLASVATPCTTFPSSESHRMARCPSISFPSSGKGTRAVPR